MMLRRGVSVVVLALACAGGASAVSAQESGSAVGAVVDSLSGAPLASATVGVYEQGATRPIAGALTDPNGRFVVRGLRPGHYLVRASFLGHAARQGMAMVEAGATANVGRIVLPPRAIEIGGVTVTAERAAIAVKVDRVTVTPDRAAAATGTAATDLLRTLPGLDVDADGNVTLRGQPVAVHLNGRPAPLSGDALANFLQQLPAAAITRIDLVTSPSAKDDPEGLGGIVDLQLGRAVSSASVTGNAAVGTGGRLNGGAGTGYRAGGLDLSANASYRDDYRANGGTNWREAGSPGAPTNVLEESSEGRSDLNGGVVALMGGYRPTKRDGLSFSAVANRFNMDARTSTAGTTAASGASPVAYAASNAHGMRHDMLMSALGYRRTDASGATRLAGDLRFDVGSTRNSSEFDRSSTGLVTNEQDAESGRMHTFTSKLDAAQPLGARWKLEAGAQGVAQGLSGDYRTRMDAAAENRDYRYRQNVESAYGQFAMDGGTLGVQAGLRAEHEGVALDEEGARVAERDRIDLFPSAALLWKRHGEWQLAFTRRVRRPESRLLSPYPMADDPLNRLAGNPQLQPEFTNAAEASTHLMAPFGMVHITPYYRVTSGAIRQIREFDATTGILLTTWKNVSTATAYGTDVMWTGHPVANLSANVSGGVFRIRTDASPEYDLEGVRSVAWTARANLGWAARPGTVLQATGYFRSPTGLEQGHSGGFATTELSLRQRVLGDRGQLALRVADPLNSVRYTYTIDTDAVRQRTTRRMGGRAVYLGFSFSLGKAVTDESVQPTHQHESDDTEPPDVPQP